MTSTHNNVLSCLETGRLHSHDQHSKVLLKMHRAKSSIEFLTTAQAHRVMPHFTKISRQVLSQVSWSKETVLQKRMEKLQKEINDKQNTLDFLETKFQTNFDMTCSALSLSPSQKSKVLKIYNKFILYSEKQNDNRRSIKLQNLLKQTKISNQTVEIVNLSNVSLPLPVQMVLRKGLDSPIGGKSKMIDILSKFEKLSCEWEKHAKIKKINPIKIHEVKTKIANDFHALRKCQSNSNDSSVLRWDLRTSDCCFLFLL